MSKQLDTMVQTAYVERVAQVQTAYVERVAQVQTQKAVKEQEDQNARANAIAEVTERLRKELGDLYALLEAQLEYATWRDTQGGIGVRISFMDEGTRWDIVAHVPRRQNDWHIETSRSFLRIEISRYPKRGALLEELLVAIGEVRLEKQRLDEENRINGLRRVAQAAANAWNGAAKEIQQAERLREAERVDAEIRAMIEARIDEARANLWRWKDHIEITFYKLKWLAATSSFEDGVDYNFEEGFTRIDELDERGYISVFGIFNAAHRRIKLDMEVHKPVWEELTASSVEQLPWGLAMDESLRIDGIGYIDDDHLDYKDYDSVTRTIAQLPVLWVRRLVEATNLGVAHLLRDDFFTAESL